MIRFLISPKYDYITQEELEELSFQTGICVDDLKFYNGFVQVYIRELGTNIYAYIEREGIRLYE